jgi:membrane-associated phospholipid phosphatase
LRGLSEQAGWPMRMRHLLVNSLAFALAYPLTNHLAQQANAGRSIALPFDLLIPFVPWMIVPYLSSGIFFVLGFVWVRSKDEVRVLSQRLLLATVAAALIFAVYPLRFSAARPPLDAPLWTALFGFLSMVDRPYNQMPSLHVAYCLIFWQSLAASVKRTALRIGLSSWLTLVAIATVFTYQHHVLDIACGLLLGALTIYVVRPGRPEANVAFYYLMGAGLAVLTGVLYLKSWLALYLAASLALVSLAYAREDPFFLHKRNGRFPFLVWLLYAPYLLGYLLTWQAVRFRERHRAPFMRLNEQLWIGRRLSNREAALLPPDCVVFDLANELSETPCLHTHRYRHFPLLDLRLPDAALIDEIVDAIIQEAKTGRPIYLHCAMGYSRSKLIAAHLQKKFVE